MRLERRKNRKTDWKTRKMAKQNQRDKSQVSYGFENRTPRNSALFAAIRAKHAPTRSNAWGGAGKTL